MLRLEGSPPLHHSHTGALIPSQQRSHIVCPPGYRELKFPKRSSVAEINTVPEIRILTCQVSKLRHWQHLHYLLQMQSVLLCPPTKPSNQSSHATKAFAFESDQDPPQTLATSGHRPQNASRIQLIFMVSMIVIALGTLMLSIFNGKIVSCVKTVFVSRCRKSCVLDERVP